MKKVQTKISKSGNERGTKTPVHTIGHFVTEGNKIVVEPQLVDADVRHKSLREIYKGFKETKKKDADSYFLNAQGREIW